eukprot:Lithocolla_globosa_v1_NODE_8892_length_770_cov_16.239161.p2 type:complete len:149 gc:universal NODE_8892_length_770_cov_16.239161:168-614(+)
MWGNTHLFVHGDAYLLQDLVYNLLLFLCITNILHRVINGIVHHFFLHVHQFRLFFKFCHDFLNLGQVDLFIESFHGFCYSFHGICHGDVRTHGLNTHTDCLELCPHLVEFLNVFAGSDKVFSHHFACSHLPLLGCDFDVGNELLFLLF